MFIDNLKEYKDLFSEEVSFLKRLREGSKNMIEVTSTLRFKQEAEEAFRENGFSIEPFDKDLIIYIYKKKMLNGIETLLTSSISFLAVADVLPLVFRIKSEDICFNFKFDDENESFYLGHSDSLFVNDNIFKAIKENIPYKGVTIKKNEYVFHYQNEKMTGHLSFDLEENTYKFVDSSYSDECLFEGSYTNSQFSIDELSSLLALNYEY